MADELKMGMATWAYTPPNPIANYMIGIEISQPLDPKIIEEISALHPTLADDLPRKSEQQSITVQPGFSQAQSSLAGIVFDEVERDGQIKKQLAVLPGLISFSVARYKRWEEFWPLADRVLKLVAEVALKKATVTGFVLVATNKFYWHGRADDIDYTALLRLGCEFIAPNLLKQRNLCHCFHGFMTPHAFPSGRRIDNVNFTAGGIMVGLTPVPVDLVFSLRLILDNPIADFSCLAKGAPHAMDFIFRDLHASNNELFAKVITESICRDIPGVPTQ